MVKRAVKLLYNRYKRVKQFLFYYINQMQDKYQKISMEKKQEIQLLNIFHSLFSPDNLRKNIYLFKHLHNDLTLKFKIILQERQVASVTNNQQTIRNALLKCEQVQIVEDSIKIHLKGDLSVIRVIPKQSKKNYKKQILSKVKDMKIQVKEQNSHVDVSFQSEAAANEFVERVKDLQNKYQFQVREKDPYLCLQDSIRLFIKQRNNQNHPNVYGQQNYQVPHMYSNSYRFVNQEQYPIFIRKAVDSDDEEDKGKKIGNKKYKQKEVQRVRLDSGDFPSIQVDNDKS